VLRYNLVVLALAMTVSAQTQTPVTITERMYVCKGGHPRCDAQPGSYSYHQFKPGNLKDFAVFAEVLPPGPPLIHYQTLLSELISLRADTNAVAVWGDAAAGADKAKVWGGFFSARSGSFPGPASAT